MTDVREAVLSCLSEGAYLKTARGSGLFVTNDLSGKDALRAKGFSCAEKGNLLLIGLDGGFVRQMIREMTPEADVLFLQLARLSERKITPSETALLEEAARMGQPGGFVRPDFEKRLRMLTALCLRTGQGGGALALIRKIQLHTKKRIP